MKASVSISRQSHVRGEGTIVLEVKDASSNLIITRIGMEFSDFAECLTGASDVEGLVLQYPQAENVEKFGKTLVTQKVEIVLEDWMKGIDREGYEEFVDPYIPEGWHLVSSGLGRKQNPGKHAFIVGRYE